MSVSLEGRKGLSHPFLIKKLTIFFPFFRAATNHFGLWPLPAQVPPDRLRYFGGTFLPFNDELPEALRSSTWLRPSQPTASLALSEAQATFVNLIS